MASIAEIVDDYVKTMKPLGQELAGDLDRWAADGMPYDGVVSLLPRVHKFSGSAGSTGFLQLSMISILMEIGLRAAKSQVDLSGLSGAQLSILISDFADAVADLRPEASTFDADTHQAIFTAFQNPGHVLLVGLPPVLEGILNFVVEQRMAIPLILPDVAMLDDVSTERPPKLVIVSEAVKDYSLPIFHYSPMTFAQLTADWP